MRLFGRIIGFLVAVVVILAAVAFFLPREITLERSITIAASPEAVFPAVNNLQAFTTWSPWQKQDPSMKQTFTGPPEGVGAKMAWDSEKMGTGTQEITASVPNEKVEMALDFGGMQSNAWFTLAAANGGTDVTWGLKADLGMNPVSRWFGLILPGMIGADYESGLAALKAKAEAK